METGRARGGHFEIKTYADKAEANAVLQTHDPSLELRDGAELVVGMTSAYRRYAFIDTHPLPQASGDIGATFYTTEVGDGDASKVDSIEFLGRRYCKDKKALDGLVARFMRTGVLPPNVFEEAQRSRAGVFVAKRFTGEEWGEVFKTYNPNLVWSPSEIIVWYGRDAKDGRAAFISDNDGEYHVAGYSYELGYTACDCDFNQWVKELDRAEQIAQSYVKFETTFAESLGEAEHRGRWGLKTEGEQRSRAGVVKAKRYGIDEWNAIRRTIHAGLVAEDPEFAVWYGRNATRGRAAFVARDIDKPDYFVNRWSYALGGNSEIEWDRAVYTKDKGAAERVAEEYASFCEPSEVTESVLRARAGVFEITQRDGRAAKEFVRANWPGIPVSSVSHSLTAGGTTLVLLSTLLDRVLVVKMADAPSNAYKLLTTFAKPTKQSESAAVADALVAAKNYLMNPQTMEEAVAPRAKAGVFKPVYLKDQAARDYALEHYPWVYTHRVLRLLTLGDAVLCITSENHRQIQLMAINKFIEDTSLGYFNANDIEQVTDRAKRLLTNRSRQIPAFKGTDVYPQVTESGRARAGAFNIIERAGKDAQDFIGKQWPGMVAQSVVRALTCAGTTIAICRSSAKAVSVNVMCKDYDAYVYECKGLDAMDKAVARAKELLVKASTGAFSSTSTVRQVRRVLFPELGNVAEAASRHRAGVASIKVLTGDAARKQFKAVTKFDSAWVYATYELGQQLVGIIKYGHSTAWRVVVADHLVPRGFYVLGDLSSHAEAEERARKMLLPVPVQEASPRARAGVFDVQVYDGHAAMMRPLADAKCYLIPDKNDYRLYIGRSKDNLRVVFVSRDAQREPDETGSSGPEFIANCYAAVSSDGKRHKEPEHEEDMRARSDAEVNFKAAVWARTGSSKQARVEWAQQRNAVGRLTT